MDLFPTKFIISEQIQFPKFIYLNFQISGKLVLIRRETIFPETWKFRYMNFVIFIYSEMMEFDLKWVHMARYELILRLDGALWLRIILKPLLTQRTAIKIPKWPQQK